MSIQLNVNVVTVAGSVETVVGTALDSTQDDYIKGSTDADVIDAGAGNDRIWAGAGDDIVSGGKGDDILYGEKGNDYLFGGEGNDILRGGDDDDWLFGGDGNDYLYGDAGNDTIDGGDGNDLSWGGSGNDILNGGAGNDMLSGGSGNDRLTGGSGADRFEYWLNNAVKSVNFSSEFGKDAITDFTSGTDKIDMRTIFERMADADVAKVLNAADSLVGDDGSYAYNISLPGFSVKAGVANALTGEFTTLGGDHYRFDISAQIVNGVSSTVISVVNLDNKADTGMSVTLENVADITGSDFLRETVKVVHGDSGANEMHGDSYELGSKGAKLYGFGGDDTLHGTKNSDWLYGGDGTDQINGADGNDYLYGENGVDTLHGGDGNDQIWGGNGDDFLFGDAGNDLLYAGVGNDRLTGGGGKDTFIVGGSVNVDWAKGTAAFNVETGSKVITDFTVGEDKIRFADFIPDWNLQTSQLRQQFVSTWFDEHAKMHGTTLVISGDNNGTAAGGEWSLSIEGGQQIYDDVHANAAHASSYFSFV
ncbi:hypothetical protein FVER53590_28983 [Fusarium verticillioides]|nr:hypothetical protein FVER53590_28983 [Fusarium verticillioides]